MGMTATNMAILEPGSVSLQLDGSTVVGPASDGTNTAAAKRAAQLLRATGLHIDEHANVLGVQYNKLAINALGYASCLSASNFITEAICHGPWRTAIGLPIVEECSAVFDKAGIMLDKIPGRRSPEEITLFKSLGVAVEDLAAAEHLLRRAREDGAGTEVELGGLRDAAD